LPRAHTSFSRTHAAKKNQKIETMVSMTIGPKKEKRKERKDNPPPAAL
jgi:hypothetical protein